MVLTITRALFSDDLRKIKCTHPKAWYHQVHVAKGKDVATLNTALDTATNEFQMDTFKCPLGSAYLNYF